MLQELGLFGSARYLPTALLANVNTPDAQALALEAARASIVLLKNNAVTVVGPPSAAGATSIQRVLPLDVASTSTVAVIGPNADVLQLGDYSGYGVPENFVTALEGIQAVSASLAAGTVRQLCCTVL